MTPPSPSSPSSSSSSANASPSSSPKAQPEQGASANAPESDRAFAQRALDAEVDAIRRITLDDRFDQAVDLVSGSQASGGSLIVSGMGKSGLIGQKLSATFASTGTHSHVLHPSEAMHGDLGRVRAGDVVLLLSYGGNTEEVVTLATLLKQDGVASIAIVSKPECDLGRLANVVLTIGDVVEACPLNLAPTASTTAMMALGDALALAVSRRRNFSHEDFRKFHPGGLLGKQLMPVAQAMRFRVGDNLPLIADSVSVQQAYAQLAEQRSGVRLAGAMLVVNGAGRLAGIFTDGDLRRLVLQRPTDALTLAIREVMTADPRRLTADAPVRDAVQMVREHRIDEIPVVDGDGVPVGLIDIQDLMALKVIE